MTNDTILYLDHAATTPVRPEVKAAMEPFLGDRFGNPSSGHRQGRAARAALEAARERVAAALGARSGEIVFTAGGTEADNLAVLGRCRAAGGGVAISAVEHSAVRESAAVAAREGHGLSVIAVDEQGRLDPGALDEVLRDGPALVSVIWGNNEVGTIQPVEAIAERCREHGATFHTDAVQAAGHVPVRVDRVACDLLALSAHKIGGPAGTGALFIREGVTIEPLAHGGGQERGLRAGTSNVAGAVGLAEALDRAVDEVGKEAPRLSALRDRLESALLERLPGLDVHGAGAPRLPHILNVGLADVPGDVLFAGLDIAGLAVSPGSACHSATPEPSHVLLAMGAGDGAAVRFSLGWTTTEDEVDAAARLFVEIVDRNRAALAHVQR